jgi:hypothetical protein
MFEHHVSALLGGILEFMFVCLSRDSGLRNCRLAVRIGSCAYQLVGVSQATVQPATCSIVHFGTRQAVDKFPAQGMEDGR